MTQAEVSTADLLLGAFCRKFEHCTPNMHLHLHLKNCILDHGPAHSFWCFSFERYNGLYHTNQKNIEIQIMRKFIGSQMLLSEKVSVYPEFFAVLNASDKRKSTLPSVRYADTDCVSLLNLSTAHLPDMQITLFPFFRPHAVVYWMQIM